MSGTTITFGTDPASGQVPTWLAVVLTAVVVAPVAAAFAWTVAGRIPSPRAPNRPPRNRSR